jgi:hypothetical protein
MDVGDIPVVGGLIKGLGMGGAAASPVDSAQTDEDRQQALDAYNQFMGDRGVAQTNVPIVQAGHATAGNIDQSQIDPLRQRDTGYLDALTAAANGQAPSAAQMQFQRQQQDIAAQQQGMAGQARGTAGVAARRDAMANIAQGQQRAGTDAAMMRAQEQAVARGQLGGALSDARTAEQGLAMGRAGMETQTSLANAGYDTSASGANATNSLTGQSITNQFKGVLGNQALGALGVEQGATGMKLTNEQANRGRQAQIYGASVGALAAGGAAAATKSDERAKKAIGRDSDADVHEFLNALEEHSYQYRDGQGPPGEHHGPMAQELEKTKIGRGLVQTGPDGMKRVDTERLTLALAGAVARMARGKRGRRG